MIVHPIMNNPIVETGPLEGDGPIYLDSGKVSGEKLEKYYEESDKFLFELTGQRCRHRFIARSLETNNRMATMVMFYDHFKKIFYMKAPAGMSPARAGYWSVRIKKEFFAPLIEFLDGICPGRYDIDQNGIHFTDPEDYSLFLIGR